MIMVFMFHMLLCTTYTTKYCLHFLSGDFKDMKSARIEKNRLTKELQTHGNICTGDLCQVILNL